MDTKHQQQKEQITLTTLDVMKPKTIWIICFDHIVFGKVKTECKECADIIDTYPIFTQVQATRFLCTQPSLTFWCIFAFFVKCLGYTDDILIQLTIVLIVVIIFVRKEVEGANIIDTSPDINNP